MPIKEFALRFDRIIVPVRNSSESDKRESVSLLQDTQGLFQLFGQYSNLRTITEEQIRAYMQIPDGIAYLQKTLGKIGKLITHKSTSISATDISFQEIQQGYKMQKGKDLPEMVVVENIYYDDFMYQSLSFYDKNKAAQWLISRSQYNSDDVYLEPQGDVSIEINTNFFKLDLSLSLQESNATRLLESVVILTDIPTQKIMVRDDVVLI